MSRFFSRDYEKTVIRADQLKEGDMVAGDIVDCVQIDIGMAVVYYKSGNYSLFLKNERVQIARRNQNGP